MREVGKIFEIYGGFDHVLQTQSRRFQDRLHVLEYSFRLILDCAINELARRGIERNLAAEENQIANAYCLRIRSDRFGRPVGCNDLFQRITFRLFYF